MKFTKKKSSIPKDERTCFRDTTSILTYNRMFACSLIELIELFWLECPGGKKGHALLFLRYTGNTHDKIKKRDG